MTFTKTIAAAIAALALPVLATAAPLTITVEGIEKTQGTLRIGVFTADGYDAGDSVTGVDVTVDAASETAIVEDLEPGEYGIKMFHDIDDDGNMSTNPFGMPTEPFAFSNDAKGRFGPAKWDAAKFVVTADGAVQIINLN
jgi:uncharacterized protein (DUF2141 family)